MLALIAQIAPPTSADNPWVWITGVLAAAIPILFWQLIAAKDKQIARAEKREDALLDDGRKSAAIIADQTGTVKEVLLLARGISERLDRLERGIEALAKRDR